LKRGLLAAGHALAVVFVSGIGSPLPAQAQERIDSPYDWIDRSLRLGAYAGHIGADRGSSEIGPGSTSVFGARLRTRVSSPLSIELNTGLGRSDRYVIDPRPEDGPAAVDTVDVGWLLIEGGFQVALTGARTLHRLQPYVTLTGGILLGIDEEQSASLAAPEDVPFRYEVGTAGVFSGGVGVEWLPTGRLGVGLEVRDHLWRIKTPDGFFQADILERIEELELPAPRETEWVHNLELSASLHYYF
jgi:hypothetical protein